MKLCGIFFLEIMLNPSFGSADHPRAFGHRSRGGHHRAAGGQHHPHRPRLGHQLRSESFNYN